MGWLLKVLFWAPRTGIHATKWKTWHFGKHECDVCLMHWAVAKQGPLPSYHWMTEAYERTN